MNVRRHLLVSQIIFQKNTIQDHTGVPSAWRPDNSEATLPAISIQILSRDEYARFEKVAQLLISENTYSNNIYYLDESVYLPEKVTAYTLKNPRGAVSLFTLYFTNEESASSPSTRDYES